MTNDRLPDGFELLLDPEDVVSGVEGVAATTAEQYATRMRMLAGDDAGVDIVERLRFHAEREWRSPVRVSSPLMAEAATLIEELRDRRRSAPSPPIECDGQLGLDLGPDV